MKKLLSIALSLVALAAVSAAESDVKTAMGEEKWFDMQNCEFCKNLVADEKLLDNMTWEHHDVAAGVLCVTSVAPAYKESYQKAQAAMMALGEAMATGKRNPAEVKMCGHCQHYGQLMMTGAKVEYVQSGAADIVLITSADEAVVKQIKEFGEKNRTELAKWKEAKQAEK